MSESRMRESITPDKLDGIFAEQEEKRREREKGMADRLASF